ncbi:MAG: GDSL-type esterase/lipase family protein [Thermodesulfobacteriota bacterium]
MTDLTFPLEYAAFRHWQDHLPGVHAALGQGLAELAGRVRETGRGRARLLIYGGSTSGCVAYAYLRNSPGFEVVGVADRNHPLPSLRGLPHVLPGRTPVPALDVLLLALSPAHYQSVCAEFAATLPGRPLICGMFRPVVQAAPVSGTAHASYAESLKRFHAGSRPVHASIVMLGDSITCNFDWNELLGRVDVCNRGVNGDRMEGILARLNSVISLRPRMVCMMGGVNDLLQGSSHKDVLHTYSRLVVTLREAGIGLVVQSTLHVSPLFAAGTDIGAVNREVEALNRGLRRLCAETGSTFLDLNPRLSVNGELNPAYTHNGLHLCADGYLEWREALKPLLESCPHPASCPCSPPLPSPPRGTP